MTENDRKIYEQCKMDCFKAESEICAIYEDAGAEVFNYAADSADISDIVKSASKPMSKAMKNTWKASLKKTVTEAINLTKTTAVTSQTAYITACDLAHMQVASGAFTYQEAIKRAISSAINQGVNVVYPSGHISSLDTAVRRSVLTGVNQTAGQLQDMRAEEIECDLMEITAHAGARPDHAQWQGQIVSRSGRRGYLSLDDIGYGRVDGFMGANCRHNWHMYFEGISKPAYSKEMLTEYNGNTVQYNGKTLTDYEASQKQRTLERAVKKQKQKLVCTETAIKSIDDDVIKAELKADFDRQAVKLKERESKLDDFCKQTGRKIDSHRVQVYGFDRSVSSKAVWGNKRVANSANGGIIKVGEDKMRINNIDSPIETRNTAKGNPNAIIHADRPLNTRQQKLLDNLQGFDSKVIVKKNSVNMKDLSALTAYTGDEFALFTKGKERLVIRGNNNSVNIDIDKAIELNKQGYRWSGHTHPGIDKNVNMPSFGDKGILECFNQDMSVIYNSKGQYRTFEKE